MKREPWLYAIAVIAFTSLSSTIPAQKIVYPLTPTHVVYDTIYGKVIADPYRWLEDINSDQSKQWYRSQAALTDSILDKIPGRDALIKEYQQLDKLTPTNIQYINKKGNRYFYQKTSPGDNLAKLYYREGDYGKEVLLFDPVKYANSKEAVSFQYSASEDGKKIALALAEKTNADVSTTKILDVDTRKMMIDSLFPAYPDAWSPDNKGFIYSLLSTSDAHSNSLFQNIQLKYHLVGSDSRNDKVLLSKSFNPELNLNASDLLYGWFSPDGKYILSSLWAGTQEQFRSFYAPITELAKKKINWKPLIRVQDNAKDAIIYKERVYFLSRKEAANYKVTVQSLDQVHNEIEKTVIAETSEPIDAIALSKDFLFAVRANGVTSTIVQFNLNNGKTSKVQLPFEGNGWIQTLGANTNTTILNLSSWNHFQTRYTYDPVTSKTSISTFNTAISYLGMNDIEVEETEARSIDGELIPLSIYYNKKLRQKDGNALILRGYGSYGASLWAFFNPLDLPLLNKGVIIAVAHVRGGGEKGHQWHMKAFKATKANTWKDFIACAEYLVRNKYTASAKLIGEGMSAGGILIGRAMTERPDLFAVTINNVPVSNPLRGENRPNGLLDAQEFGTIKDSAEAMGLIEMDSYLHVDPTIQYPAVLAIGGIYDTRVPVWQPGKLVAAMQNVNKGNRPVVLMVNYDSGHWSDEKSIQFRVAANTYAFALWQVGHPDFKMKE